MQREDRNEERSELSFLLFFFSPPLWALLQPETQKPQQQPSWLVSLALHYEGQLQPAGLLSSVYTL